MKIATWNVNSVRTRLERLLAWLDRHQPDVLCLQELKCTDAQYPDADIRNECGYQSAVHGQATYNGVALLSTQPLADVAAGMGDNVDADNQARLIGGELGNIRIYSAYVPNGGGGSDKFQYKLDWLERLRIRLTQDIRAGRSVMLCGDLNVAFDDNDVANPAQWTETVLCDPAVRGAMRGLLDTGLVDLFRQHHPDGGIYSWWDYRLNAFQNDDGLRIDYILATPDVAERCTSATIDRDERRGRKPSDHAPVVVEIE